MPFKIPREHLDVEAPVKIDLKPSTVQVNNTALQEGESLMTARGTDKQNTSVFFSCSSRNTQDKNKVLNHFFPQTFYCNKNGL